MHVVKILKRTVLALLCAGPAFAMECEPPLSGMASHPQSQRHFNSVVIAVHGWAGACTTTFGSEKSAMLDNLRASNAVDVDCFAYKSVTGSLADARACFELRLADLAEAGYREFALITHSTGGIVALDAITRAGLAATSPDGTGWQATPFDPDGLKLRALLAWAAPIEGMRGHFEPAAATNALIAWLSGHEAILPDLVDDSDFLVDLKRRLIAYDRAIIGPPKEDRLAFDMVFLHGQAEDWVVGGIDRTADWWPNNLGARLVETSLAHLDTVSASGTQDVPRFPALVSEDRLQLAMSLMPRFVPYFSQTAPQSDDMENARIAIASGIADFIGNPSSFADGRSVTTELIRRMVNGGYRRSAANDEAIVAKLTGVIDQWFDNAPVNKAFDLGSQILGDLAAQAPNMQPTAGNESFGGGSTAALRRMLCSLADTLIKVEQREAATVMIDEEARNRFAKAIINVFSNLFARLPVNSPEDDCAIRLFDQAARTVDPQVIRDSRMLQTLQSYATQNRFDIGTDRKAQLAEIYLAMLERPELSEAVAGSASTQVTWLGGADAPLWSTFFTDEQTARVSTVVARDGFLDSQTQDLLSSIIARSGASGTRPEIGIATATDWLRETGPLLADQPAAQQEVVNRIFEAARDSGYPVSIEQALRPAAQAVFPATQLP